MQFSRRDIGLAGTAALILAATASAPALAQGGEEAAVAAAVEALRQAMLAADKAKLVDIAHEKLSYSHSSGKLENRTEYSDVIASRKSVFKTITLSDHNNVVVGDNAIVRHTFAAEIDRGEGKLDAVKIGILQVWKKEASGWKLLARQGYKL